MNIFFSIMASDKLEFITFNVRGLKKNKRTALFNFLKEPRLSVIALQETHLGRKDVEDVKREWSGSVHYSEAEGRSKGLLTLFGRGIDKEKVELVHSENMILLSRVNIMDQWLYCYNIYTVRAYYKSRESYR